MQQFKAKFQWKGVREERIVQPVEKELPFWTGRILLIGSHLEPWTETYSILKTLKGFVGLDLSLGSEISIPLVQSTMEF